MDALSASHSRAADATSVSSTVCRSKAERLMTLSAPTSTPQGAKIHNRTSSPPPAHAHRNRRGLLVQSEFPERAKDLCPGCDFGPE
jgi:hypothetical protein